jgi:hypothetical protein
MHVALRVTSMGDTLMHEMTSAGQAGRPLQLRRMR